jgi:putative membrane protein
MLFFVILALLIAIFAVVFALQNTSATEVSFLFWQFHGSLALILIVTLVVGGIVAFLFYLPYIIRHHGSMRKLRKHASELESNLNENKQHLADALIKLQEPPASSQPSQSEPKPPDQSTSTS